MRIELIKTTPDRAGRFYVQLDNGIVLRLYRQTIEDFGLYTSLELSEEQYVSLKHAAAEMSAKMRAVRIISQTNVSSSDLENRLVQKGESPKEAKQAIEWLVDLHLLDDRKTAEQIVNSCISKGYGISRARQALYEKRISKELREDALSNYPDQLEWILSFLETKIRDPNDDKAVKKAVDTLIRRGHKYSVIRSALNQMLVDTDEFPEGE